MIVASLLTRHPSLFARLEWSAVTSRKYASDNDTFGQEFAYILDTLSHLPTLFHQQDIITQCSGPKSSSIPIIHSSSLSKLQSLLDHALNLLNGIQVKMKQWRIAYPDTEFSTFPRASIPSAQPYPCAVVTHYSSEHRAYLSTFYNTSIILFNQFVLSINELLPNNPQTVNMATLASGRITFAVIEILRSVDYSMNYIGESAGEIYYVLFPIRIAYQALSKSTSAEAISQKLWIEDMLSFISGKAGSWTYNKKIFGVEIIGSPKTQKLGFTSQALTSPSDIKDSQ